MEYQNKSSEAIAFGVLYQRIQNLQQALIDVAEMYEKADSAEIGSYAYGQIAYDMRCIARSALQKDAKP
mgnify:CR=1 FL=1